MSVRSRRAVAERWLSLVCGGVLAGAISQPLRAQAPAGDTAGARRGTVKSTAAGEVRPSPAPRVDARTRRAPVRPSAVRAAATRAAARDSSASGVAQATTTRASVCPAGWTRGTTLAAPTALVVSELRIPTRKRDVPLLAPCRPRPRLVVDTLPALLFVLPPPPVVGARHGSGALWWWLLGGGALGAGVLAMNDGASSPISAAPSAPVVPPVATPGGPPAEPPVTPPTGGPTGVPGDSTTPPGGGGAGAGTPAPTPPTGTTSGTTSGTPPVGGELPGGGIPGVTVPVDGTSGGTSGSTSGGTSESPTEGSTTPPLDTPVPPTPGDATASAVVPEPDVRVLLASALVLGGAWMRRRGGRGGGPDGASGIRRAG